jgi:hypothetical protein
VITLASTQVKPAGDRVENVMSDASASEPTLYPLLVTDPEEFRRPAAPWYEVWKKKQMIQWRQLRRYGARA